MCRQQDPLQSCRLYRCGIPTISICRCAASCSHCCRSGRPPKQSTFVCAVIVAANAAAGSVMVTVAVVVHPPASVTVTVYVPAARPVAVADRLYRCGIPTISICRCAASCSHCCRSGRPPKQSTFVCAVIVAANAAAGSVMVTVAVVVHPPASVTVTVYVPAARPVAV